MFHRFRVLSTVTLEVYKAVVGEDILADVGERSSEVMVVLVTFIIKLNHLQVHRKLSLVLKLVPLCETLDTSLSD